MKTNMSRKSNPITYFRSHRRIAFVAWFLFVNCAAAESPYRELVIFGDSLSDSGNVGLLLQGRVTREDITSNGYIPPAPYASNVFSDGEVWSSRFAAAHGLESLPSLPGGTNYAFGSARTSVMPPLSPPSLTFQVGMYLDERQFQADPNSLFVIAGGGNDARDTLAAISSGASSQVAISTDSAFGQISWKRRRHSGRKHQSFIPQTSNCGRCWICIKSDSS